MVKIAPSRSKHHRHTCSIIPPNEYMSLCVVGLIGNSSSGSPSNSGASHLMFPWNAEVQEAAEMLITSEYIRERPKSARQAVPSP